MLHKARIMGIAAVLALGACGTPMENSGTPMENSGTPMENSGTPMENSGTPIEDSSTRESAEPSTTTAPALSTTSPSTTTAPALSTTSPSTTGAPTTTSPPGPTTTGPAGVGEPIEGTFTFAAGEAGSVTFTVSGPEITVDEVAPADGWTHMEDQEEPEEIEVEFIAGGAEVEFKAEIERGTLVVEVKTERSAADGTFSVDAFEAATVTFTVSGINVALDEVVPAAAGWTFMTDLQEAREGDLQIELLNPGISTKTEFEAEVDDEGRELEVDLEITIGPDFDPSR